MQSVPRFLDLLPLLIVGLRPNSQLLLLPRERKEIQVLL